MKRFVGFMLLFVLSFNLFSNIIFAEKASKNEAEEYKIETTSQEFECNSVLLMEAETGQILYAENESAAASPASVTKIMTLLIVMEAIENGSINKDEMVSVSAYAAGMGGSQVFLEEGEQMTVEELIKCTVIASGNDSAVALAEHVAGSEESFVRKMNERAAELGLKNTNFENVTGLDDTTQNHVSSALDIAIMSRELIKHTLITEYSSIWQDTIRNGEFTLTNTNRLVRFYEGCNGLKTGSTDKAGYCISATAKRGNMQLIAVVMGAPTRDVRNSIAKTLLDTGFANYSFYSDCEAELEVVPVYNGNVEKIPVYSKEFCALVNKADIKKIEKIYEIPEFISAPQNAGNAVGKIKYMVDGKILGETDIVVKDEIHSLSLLDIFCKFMRIYIGLERKNDK